MMCKQTVMSGHYMPEWMDTTTEPQKIGRNNCGIPMMLLVCVKRTKSNVISDHAMHCPVENALESSKNIHLMSNLMETLLPFYIQG